MQHANALHVAAAQAVVSASTIALREALIEQEEEQQAALDALTVPAGCNRTADMQYTFLVGFLQLLHDALP